MCFASLIHPSCAWFGLGWQSSHITYCLIHTGFNLIILVVAGLGVFRAARVGDAIGVVAFVVVALVLVVALMLVVALVENLQREDLGPLEEAVGYQQLIDGFGLTQKEVARRVGRDRSTVANALRLLTLPAAVRELLSDGSLSAGHARAVLSIDGEAAQVLFAREMVAKGLSVREAEARARSGRKREGPGAKRGPAHADPVATKAAILLSRAYGTDVKVSLRSRTAGEIRIPFRDPDDFERLARELLAPAEADELFGAL